MSTNTHIPKKARAAVAMSTAIAMMFARAQMSKRRWQVGPPAPAYNRRSNQAKRRRIERRLRGGQ